MSRYIVDTSVVIAWYFAETFATAARDWQRRCLESSVTLVVPGLHYWEVGNVLRTRVRRGEVTASLACEIYDLHLQAPLEVAEPSRDGVLQRALEFDATVYDAVFIELALQQGVSLVTAEKTTSPWVVRLGEQAITVR